MASGVLLPSPEILDARPPLARELTVRRIKAGLSQQALADRVGLHVLTISSFEVGRMVPSEATLAKLKAAIGWR